jgi:hypothetical protein
MLMWHKRRGCGNHHPNGNVRPDHGLDDKNSRDQGSRAPLCRHAAWQRDRVWKRRTKAKLARRDLRARRIGGSDCFPIAGVGLTPLRSTTKLLQE